MDSSLFFFHVWLRFILIYNYFQLGFLNKYLLFQYLIIFYYPIIFKDTKVTNMLVVLHPNLLNKIKPEVPFFRLLHLVAAAVIFSPLPSSNTHPSPNSFSVKLRWHLSLPPLFLFLIQSSPNTISSVYPFSLLYLL